MRSRRRLRRFMRRRKRKMNMTLRGRWNKLLSHVGLRQMDFLKYSGKTEISGRNRPTFAIWAQVGLFGTSVSRNCWVLDGILRKSHFPAQAMRGQFVPSACVDYDRTNCFICLCRL